MGFRAALVCLLLFLTAAGRAAARDEPQNPPCTFALDQTSVTVPAAGGTVSVTLTTNQAPCPWTASSGSSFVTITAGASGTATAVVRMAVASNSNQGLRIAIVTIAGLPFAITQLGTGPSVTLDRTALQFTSTISFTDQTSPQTVRMTQAGLGAFTWTATPSQPWITVTPTSGTGPALLTIGVRFASGLPVAGTITGTVALNFSGVGNAPGAISVTLTTILAGSGSPPFGLFETPTDGASGVTGSIAVTGWALDDVEVRAVRIFRDPIAGEGPDLVFIGNAVFVEGSRPDVAAANPTLPRNTRAGWGYVLLTNFLPDEGNGTFRLHAVADDADGHTVDLGTKTIVCANATAVRPFGAIDTPGQGETISGTAYANFGWVLARTPARADPPNGTVAVVIDGVFSASPVGWVSRPDLTALFPVATYPGVNNALGVRSIDTTSLANGVHTIAWVVTADNGQSDGVGSRFFTVANGSALRTTSFETPGSVTGLGAAAMAVLAPSATEAARFERQAVDTVALDRAPIAARRGYDRNAPFRRLPVAAAGRATMYGEELDRFEVQLEPGTTRGYARVGQSLGPLPIGSHLDPATGVFTWQLGPGFLRTYDLVFVRCTPATSCARRELRIVVNPKASNRVGPQVVIDTPNPDLVRLKPDATGSVRLQPDLQQPFIVAGWAIDQDAWYETGIDTLHVWAYPVTTGNPIFIGAAAYGGARPDVAAIFGDRFRDSGFGIVVESLPAGTYDFAVFPWSTAQNRFAPATVVRVTVK